LDSKLFSIYIILSDNNFQEIIIIWYSEFLLKMATIIKKWYNSKNVTAK